jgi:hypothetical protein
MEISFPAAEVVRTWPDWPSTLAWNAATACPWQPSRGIPKGWIKTLPALDYLPFAELTDLLAFERAKTAFGLSQIEEEAAKLSAGIALINAAAAGAIKVVGMPCERWPDAPHLLRQTGPRAPIGPDALRDLGPVPFGGRDWLAPRRFAGAYAECGHAPESVSFCEVRIERRSVLKWLSAISARAPGLSEAAVRKFIFSEKAQSSSIGIGAIEQLARSKDPLFPREQVRRIAREIGIEGKRGRPRIKSAD